MKCHLKNCGSSSQSLSSVNLYPQLQATYQQFQSTETALLQVHNDTLRTIDNKNEVILVLLDLSTAFATIDHNILIERLQTQFGFTGKVLHWFESYIWDRFQNWVIGCMESWPQPLVSSVPQGSVLGPLLFVLYFAPLDKVIKFHALDCMMYADDSQLYIIVNLDSRHKALTKLEHCISDVHAFFIANKLCCNPSKTEIIYFHSRFISLPPLAGINISHRVVSFSKEAQNVGVVFDNHLTLSGHINSVCCSAFLTLRNIVRVRKCLDQDNSERLVHTFITSRLDYCNSLSYGLPVKEISKLQCIQNSVARLVMKCKPQDHITSLLQKLDWLPVEHRIIFKVLVTNCPSMVAPWNIWVIC